VVSVYGFGGEAQAVELANATPYGLNASVWTGDAERGARVAARLKAGTVNVNEGYAAAWASLDAPMGGMGESGIGRRHGREGILRFTEAQTVAVQRVAGFGTPPGLTDERWARAFAGLLRLLKKVGWR
jgi:succinate-semialdehyde dehydrogenase / glutarate-semialdehyde dehydrogenase